VKILVLGGTGVAGRSTLPGLAGHEVLALARSAAATEAVRAAGATPLSGDPDDPAQLRRWLDGVDVAIDLRVCIPAVNRALLPGAWREYVRLRDTAAGRLVDAAIDAGTPRVVHDTVSMVYASDDAWLDESAPVDAPGFMAANLACEAHLARLTAAGGTGVALRFSQFYGPSDAASRSVIAAARRGFAPLLLGDPDGWTSAIHIDDVGPAVALAATTEGLAGGVYNVSDGEPLRRREMAQVLGAAAGRRVRTPPRFLARLAPPALVRSQRVTSELFREATGWRPSVPSRRTGWPAAFAAAG
jgi:nucleoside-diphosphate-sugar epimerase